jgi:membrane protease YdiL (CAAX protease family)
MTEPASETPSGGLWGRFWAIFPKVDRDVAVVVLVATMALLASDYEGSPVFYNNRVRALWKGAGPFFDLGPYWWWFGTSAVLYLVIPLTVALAVNAPRLSALGFGLGNWRLGLGISAAFLAVMVPVVAVASRFGDFQGQYPLAQEALRARSAFVVYEFAYAAYFISWEFLFRGWLLLGLKDKVGEGVALWMQVLPFALMHSGKPEAEAYGSIVAGLALGLLALRTGSFWYGAGLHATVAVTMDLFAGLPRLAGHS